MDPILVDIAQLRSLTLPGITLAPGRALMARVIETAEGGRGQLSIAGGRLAVTLPPGVHAGDELRLVVKELTPDKIVLQMVPLAVPGERVEEREPGEAGARQANPDESVAFSYGTQNLGPIELRFAIRGGVISVGVAMVDEGGVARARAGAEELRSAIAAASGREVAVAVSARRPPLDVYV